MPHTHPGPQRPGAPLRRLGRYALLAVVLGGLSGCTGFREWVGNGFKVGPEYCQPGVQVADDWIDSDDKRVLSEPVDHVAWWSTSFEDPVLNELVAEAYRQNLTLREAGMRVIEARALRAFTVGNLFPQQQQFSGSHAHNLSTGFGDRHFSSWRGTFSLAWEIDFWGRFRRAVESADADLEASVFDYGDVVVTLVADVASTYIDIRTLQTRLALVKGNVENQRQTYVIAEEQFRAGATSDIDVQQAKSSLAQTLAFVPQLEAALRQTQNQLCVLLGIPPEDLTERLGEGVIPAVDSEIALGIPAETLLRRPDVRRAERLLAAQCALIGVAESNWYPRITVSGNAGRAGTHFSDLFKGGAGFGSVGPSLTWDILNYGRILANVEVQDARYQQLLASYRQTVLLANLEAENAITQFLKAQETFERQVEAAEAAGRTNELINLNLVEGEVDYNRVINVQNAKTQQEENAAQAKGAVAQGLIEIYRSLGGGWPSPYLTEPMTVLEQPGGVQSEPVPAEPIDAPPAVAPGVEI